MMNHSQSSRREFLKVTAAACVTAPVHSYGAPIGDDARPIGVDILRRPDSVFAGFSDKTLSGMHFESGAWTLPGYRLTAEPVQSPNQQELPLHLTVSAQGLSLIRLRWQGARGDDVLSIGDHWERAYGDLEWRGTIPNRIMPWYFFTVESGCIAGYPYQPTCSTTPQVWVLGRNTSQTRNYNWTADGASPATDA
jgi:alpha-galactosidase